MKKLKLIILSTILVAILIYLCGAFVIWDFDLGNMEEGGRFMLLWLYIFAVGISIAAINLSDKLKDK